LIELTDVCKHYRVGEADLPVLKGISLEIAAGDYVALMGASGSGKTTLMNVLGCLDQLSTGRYFLAGVDASQLTRDELAEFRNQQIGFVFQNFNLLPRTSALENVLMPTIYAPREPKRARVQRAKSLLEDVGLGGRLDHTPNQLSGGERQRVAIARALMNRPKLLLADEPTGNLDSRTETEIMELFRRLNREQGITLVVVTHEAEVSQQAARIVHIKDGVIANDTRPPGHAQSTAQVPRRRGEPTFSPGRSWIRKNAGPRQDLNSCESSYKNPSRHRAVAGLPTEPHKPTAGLPNNLATGSKPATPTAGMSAVNAIATATRALRRNALRTALTMLGVIIGVASVVTVMELSTGASAAIEDTVASMGASTITVQAGSGSSNGRQNWVRLTPDDVNAIAARCPAVQVAAPIIFSRVQLVHGNRNWVPTFVMGTSPEYLEARNWSELDMGQSFTRRHVQDSAKVCVIGQTVADKLFGSEYPIGQQLRANGVTLRVLGVLAPKGADVVGADQDDIILAPWTTFKYRIDSTMMPPRITSTYSDQMPEFQLASHRAPASSPRIHQIHVEAHSPDLVAEAKDQIHQLLRRRHRLERDDAIRISDMTEVSKVMDKIVGGLSALGLVIAAVSLVVGGVGIMNIMLVSVTERTREIGLRMAVGANSRAILRQFLIEATVLCLLGGIVGIAVGHFGSLVVGAAIGWPTVMSLWAPLVAVGVAASVGVIFGYYPSRKASVLNPIDALRYE